MELTGAVACAMLELRTGSWLQRPVERPVRRCGAIVSATPKLFDFERSENGKAEKIETPSFGR